MIAARGGAACLEGIVHIVQMTYGTVGGLIAPVIDDVVGKVRGVLVGHLSAEVTGDIVYYQVMVKGKVALAQHYPKAVQPLLVTSP